MATRSPPLVNAVRTAALVLGGGAADFDPLLDRVGDAQVVLIGEASHGTQEFYDLRARITRRLIEEKGFTAVAVEADWPAAYRVDRYVRGRSNDPNARAALGDFRQFPVWMWRNTEVLGFVEWLRRRNAAAGASRATGFYGLDLYSMDRSADAVIDYLANKDAAAARRARTRYACFDRYGSDPEMYGYASGVAAKGLCADEAAAQLRELDQRAAYPGPPDEELFSARQNARVVASGERYYRSMVNDPGGSWNLRDTHMMQTLDSLMRRDDGGRPQKIVVWAHNSHVGDMRATEMGERGDINIGQLARQQYRGRAVLVGFSTYQGTVTAAPRWDAPATRWNVRPGIPGSYEALFHDTGLPAFQLRLDDAALRGLATPRLQRAIGVVYQPATERASHYFNTSVTQQFDWMIHIDTTHALEPLEPGKQWTSAVPPERSPSVP